MPRRAAAVADAFKALGDPIRWSIVQQIAEQDELPAGVLETTLPVSKPTISYHAKILTQAGVIEVHKRGRNYYYRLRPEVLQELRDALSAVAPGPRPTLKLAAGDDSNPTLLTW